MAWLYSNFIGYLIWHKIDSFPAKMSILSSFRNPAIEFELFLIKIWSFSYLGNFLVIFHLNCSNNYVWRMTGNKFQSSFYQLESNRNSFKSENWPNFDQKYRKMTHLAKSYNWTLIFHLSSKRRQLNDLTWRNFTERCVFWARKLTWKFRFF